MRSLNVFNLPNPSSRAMALGFIQSLTENNAGRAFWGKARPARKVEIVTAISEQIV
jgi:hypothetical protein